MEVLSLMHDGFGKKFVTWLMQPRPQYWFARLYLCSSVLLTTSFAWLLPVSAQRLALDGIGQQAWWVLGGVTTVAAIGLLDSLVNDMMPDRFRIRWADKRRYQVYLLLAMLLWGIVWLDAQHDNGMSTPVVIRYAIDGLACVAVAIFDTIARVKQVRRYRHGG